MLPVRSSPSLLGKSAPPSLLLSEGSSASSSSCRPTDKELRETGGGSMIDLSHLTEEEQEAIMMVLKRDAELKRAEEERVRNLEKILDSSSQSDVQLKYLTGEWFYEAKSRRHNDKIHGSEIILAAMKQGKAAGLDGSVRIERSNTPSGRGSDIVVPPKPARCFEASNPQEINDAEKENQYFGVRSPRIPRHNPFNRASLVAVEPPENSNDHPDQDQRETESVSALKNQPAGDSSQASGGSVTSEGSSVGFRPVPKKRTFLSRRLGDQLLNSNQLGLDAQVRPTGVVPAPRRRPQQGSSGSSNQSAIKISDETRQETNLNQSVQPSKAADGNLHHPLCDASQVSSNLSLERERNITRNRQTSTRTDGTAETEAAQQRSDRDGQTLRLKCINLPSSNVQDEENNSSVGAGAEQEALSLTQSTMDPDPPVSYDLNYVDKSDEQNQKFTQNNVLKLSSQTASPTGEDEDSIAKVLDWFNRSTESNDWLDTENKLKASNSFNGHAAVSKSREEDSFDKHTCERKVDKCETKRNPKKGSGEQTETQEEVRMDTREQTLSQDVTDEADEGQTRKISHLKSFWEKSNTGPKILISKSVTPGDKRLNPAHFSAETDSDMPSVSVRHSGRDTHDNYSHESRQQLVISPQVNSLNSHFNNHQQEENLINNSTSSSPHLNFNRKLLNTETFCVTSCSPTERSTIHHESDSVSVVKPKLHSNCVSQSKESLELLPNTRPVPQLDTEAQTRVSLDSEKLILSKNSSYMNNNQDGSEDQVTTKAQIPRSSSEDVKKRDTEDKGVHSNWSPKRKDDAANKDRTNNSLRNRQHQESTAERIKELKSFWEQERHKPVFYTRKPKVLVDGKVTRGTSQARLNKRFTKSEFDLTSIGNESGSDEEGSYKNQRLDKMSPSIGTSRAQFDTLREFWDEATSDSRGLLTFDKPKSPKRKEPPRAQLSSQELKGVVMKSYPSPQDRSKSHDRPMESVPKVQSDSKNNPHQYVPTESEQQKQSKRSSKDSSREKSTKPPSGLGREILSPKSRKDSFSISSSRSSLRRAASMFSLGVDDEKDPEQLRMEVNPIHSQSRKPRQNTDKGPLSRRSSDEPETAAPRARAFVPTDYRHYLGMMDSTSVHTALTPVLKDKGSEVKSGNELDLGGPVRASTPTSSEERCSRTSNKASQRPTWSNYSESDTGAESSISSTSETWSNSRNDSNRTNDDDDQNLVWKALRRAEARPKNLAKSLEDITASISPWQERRPDQTVDLRRGSNAVPLPSSSSFSDPDHLKKMSKSVPSFLQKEDNGRDADSTCERSYTPERLMPGSSMMVLSSSSGMASTSSLSGSVMTMYSGDFVEVQGNIQFSINYVQRLREFHIFVAECRDLAAVDPKRNRSDPYVKSYLVPDKANLGKRKTSVKKKTLNPKFNEILRYHVRMEYLRTQTLILSIWHHDTFGRNSFLGEVDVDLSKWDFDHTQMNYLALKARTLPSVAPLNSGRGEMRLAIRFLPQITHSEGLTKGVSHTGEIHIWVKECKNLPLTRATIDPYVKCFVLPDTSRKSRQKTRVLRRTVEPVFNHTMVYDGINEADLMEACVELTVWDRDRLASNLLGGLRLGAGTGKSYGVLVDWMDSSPYEVALWERMLASPSEWVEDVVPLRMLNSAKAAFK